MSLSRAQNIFMPANINFIFLLFRSPIADHILKGTGSFVHRCFVVETHVMLDGHVPCNER